MAKYALVALSLALAGCVTPWESVPPLYRCQDIAEFGCPDTQRNIGDIHG